MARRQHYFRQIARSFAAAGHMMLQHEVPRDAAGISYFGLVALFPAILVMIALVDALLAWVYTSNLIMIFGANFSAQLHWVTIELPLPDSGTIPREKPNRFPLGR